MDIILRISLIPGEALGEGAHCLHPSQGQHKELVGQMHPPVQYGAAAGGLTVPPFGIVGFHTERSPGAEHMVPSFNK
ncbi:hypothetical protein D3C76_1522580 [compost metagenome]